MLKGLSSYLTLLYPLVEFLKKCPKHSVSRAYPNFTEIYFRHKIISLSLNAELDKSSNSMVHPPILKRLASQFWGQYAGCYFWGICTSTIFAKTEFQ